MIAIKKVLITGGAGFIGSNLARHLIGKGYQVTVLDNLQRKGSEINLKRMQKEFPKLAILKDDLDNADKIVQKLDVDAVYHFAAQVAVTKSYENPADDFRINAQGSFKVASAAGSRGIPVIYASTNKVYGDNVNDIELQELPTRWEFKGDLKGRGISESFSIDSKKHTPYGVSKLVGEMYVREFGGIANRFSCIYGENQFGDADQGWVSHFVFSKVRGIPITIYGDGKQVRDLLHIQDNVRLLEQEGLNAKKLKGEVFCVGGGHDNTISLLELCKMLDIKPKFADWRPADQKVYYSDITKASKMLNWKPEVSVKEGISRMSAWINKIVKEME
ncbi:GDP-mannose 4,6-dehydratase [Candidatus Woesearchaeota archaeon]|nr:GDP-mannose 4,6-dehydratase [Candidatus Woesearchaeota archaeon]